MSASRRSSALIASLLVVSTLAVAPGARAHGRPVVDVRIAGSAEDAEALEASLRELLVRLGLDMHATTVDDLEAAPPGGSAGDEDVVVTARIDLRSADVALVVLSDPRGRRPDMRRFVPRHDSPAIVREEVAHVVQAGTESLLSWEPPPPPTSPSPSAPAQLPAETPPAAAPMNPWRLDLATFATGSSLARDAGVVFGVGAGARLDLGPGAWRPALWLIGGYHFPFGIDSLPVALHVNLWSVRLVPALQLLEQGRLRVEVGAGGGADFSVLSPGATSPDVALDADRTDVSPILTAMIAAHVEVTRDVRAFVAAFLDGDLTPREYLLSTPTGSSSLVKPYALRTGLSIGFSFNVAGPGQPR